MKFFIALLLTIFIINGYCGVLNLKKKTIVSNGAEQTKGLQAYKNTYFYAPFIIGKNKNTDTPFNIDLAIDIMHSTFWLYQDTHSYEQELSSTSTITTNQETIYMGSHIRSMTGYTGTEQITFDENTYEQDVLFIYDEKQVSEQMQPGQLGLANDNTVVNFIEKAKNAGHLVDDIFGIDIQSDSGKLYIGSDSFPDNYDFTTKLEKFEGTYPNFWSISLTGTEIKGTTYSHTSDLAVLDFGVDEIFLYDDVYAAFATQLETAKCEKVGNNYYCSENNKAQLPTINFLHASGAPLVLDASDYLLCDSKQSIYCTVMVQSTSVSGVDKMYLGNPFFKRHFVAFEKNYATAHGTGRLGIIDKTIFNDQSIIKNKLQKFK